MGGWGMWLARPHRGEGYLLICSLGGCEPREVAVVQPWKCAGLPVEQAEGRRVGEERGYECCECLGRRGGCKWMNAEIVDVLWFGGW